MKFKVVRGVHSEGGVTYEKGDVVDSASDLRTLNSPGAIKFQILENEVAEAARAGLEGKPVPVPTGPDEFDAMTIPDLKKFASQEGIDLGTATKRDEILVLIREAVKAILS